MPYIQWYPADWLAATTMLSPATRGIWFDILNVMWQMDRAEKISGTLAEIARAGRCDAVQMQTALDELSKFHVADITARDGVVTVICRRFKKDNFERKRAATGMQKIRELRKCYGDVTEMLHPNITEDRIQKEKEKEKNPPPPVSEKYPETVKDLFAIASAFGFNLLPDTADAYLNARLATDWVDAAGRHIKASKVPYDLKKWVLADEKDGRVPSASIRRSVGDKLASELTQDDLEEQSQLGR